MTKTLSNKLNNKSGFTLVELLLVLVVLSIIAAIAIPKFLNIQQGFIEKTDVSTAQVWAHDIEAAFATGLLNDLSSNELTITVDAPAGYQGSVPVLPTDKTKHLIAKIVFNSTTQVYTLTIYPGDTTKTALVVKNISGPIE